MNLEKINISSVDYFLASLNSIGSDGMVFGILLFFILLVGFILYKLVSFIFSALLVTLLLVCFGLFLVFGSDVNIKNWSQLKDNATDILIVGKNDGCIILMANENVIEQLEIDGWKTYLGACDKAKTTLNNLVDKKKYRKLIKTKENISTCPMVFATSRNEIYQSMINSMNSNDCSTPLIFKKKVLALNNKK